MIPIQAILSGAPAPTRPAWPGAALALALMLALPAAPAGAADALNGKSLYQNGPVTGGTSCAACHGPSPAANVNGILAAANNPAVISGAFAANRGGMGALYNGKFTAAEIADLAAFIGNPSVTAAPVAALAPASLAFTGTTVGQSSAALAVTLSNTGSAPLNIGAIALAGNAPGDYAISGGSCANGAALAAGAGCTVQVTFRPTAAGTRAATLTITHNATGGASSASLSGTGNAAAQASMAVSASALDFGALLTGTASAAQTVTVSNGGQAPLTFSAISVSGAQATFFTTGGTCSAQAAVAPGANCTVTVRAQPSGAGGFAATLNLASNGGNAAIGLSGTASAAAPAVAANPAALAFGNQSVGGAAVTQTVTLTNRGNVPLAFSGITVSGSAAITSASGGTCGATLATGASCTVPLSFAPAAEGKADATLDVRSNAALLQVAVSGTGTVAPVARPVLSATGPLAFANTQVGQASAAQSVTLSNNGTAALKIASVVLSGAQAADFTLGGTCAAGVTVGPGATCTIEPAFKPLAAGARSADVVLMTDGGAQLSLRLDGAGVAVPVTTALAVTPASFDFGTVQSGASAAKRFVLANSGTAAVNVASAATSGPFAVATDSTSCPAAPFALQPGASCELPVKFTPAGTGAASGTVVLQAANGGPAWTIALSGQGAAVTPPTGQTGQTGQAAQNRGGGGCSAVQDGDDATLAILAVLAMAVLLWRRRGGAAEAMAPMESAVPQAGPVAPGAVRADAGPADRPTGQGASGRQGDAARIAATAVAALTLATASQAGAVEVGQGAPSFALNGPAGAVKLDQYLGKVVYVDFWASWCGPCRQSFPWMNEMQAKYGGRGLQVVGINVDAKTDDARAFLAGVPAQFVVAFDPSGNAPRSYGVKGMPSSVLIGPDGKVLYEHSGFRAADKAELERRIQLALGGKP